MLLCTGVLVCVGVESRAVAHAGCAERRSLRTEERTQWAPHRGRAGWCAGPGEVVAPALGRLLAAGVDLPLWTFGAAFQELHLGAWSQACGRQAGFLQGYLEDADALTSGSRRAHRPVLPGGAEVPVPPCAILPKQRPVPWGGGVTQSPPRWQCLLPKAGVIPECPSPPEPVNNAQVLWEALHAEGGVVFLPLLANKGRWCVAPGGESEYRLAESPLLGARDSRLNNPGAACHFAWHSCSKNGRKTLYFVCPSSTCHFLKAP